MYTLSECVWYIQEFKCNQWRKSIYQIIGMIDNDKYKNDKKLENDIRNTNCPSALSDLYDYFEKEYEAQIQSKKNK